VLSGERRRYARTSRDAQNLSVTQRLFLRKRGEPPGNEVRFYSPRERLAKCIYRKLLTGYSQHHEQLDRWCGEEQGRATSPTRRSGRKEDPRVEAENSSGQGGNPRPPCKAGDDLREAAPEPQVPSVSYSPSSPVSSSSSPLASRTLIFSVRLNLTCMGLVSLPPSSSVISMSYS
jgi:hypothetical protein